MPMIKHNELKTVEYKGIKITLDINYDAGTVSLVHQKDRFNGWQPKEFVFANRSLEYMNAWLLILDAIKFAVSQAKKDLESDLAEKTKFEKTEKIYQELSLIDLAIRAGGSGQNKRGKRK